MNLSQLTKSRFGAKDRLRGSDYFRAGAVFYEGFNGSTARFKVQGTEVYQVEISFDGTAAALNCTCPYFRAGFYCKHLWACILVADKLTIFDETLAKTTDLPRSNVTKPTKPNIPIWKRQLQRALKHEGENLPPHPGFQNQKISRSLYFAINLPISVSRKKIRIDFFARETLRDGRLGVLKRVTVNRSDISSFTDPKDREIIWNLFGKSEPEYEYYGYGRDSFNGIYLPNLFAAESLQVMNDAKKLLLNNEMSQSTSQILPYEFKQTPWHLNLDLKQQEQNLILTGSLTDGTDFRPLNDSIGGIGPFVLFPDFISPIENGNQQEWLALFTRNPQIEIPSEDANSFLEFYFKSSGSNPPKINLPAEFAFKDISDIKPKVSVAINNHKDWRLIVARLNFIYGDITVDRSEASDAIVDVSAKKRITRDLAFESDVYDKLITLGLTPTPSDDEDFHFDGFIIESEFTKVIEGALRYGWEVVAHQKRVIPGHDFNFKISSDIDWFDVNVNFKFKENILSLPQLLQNLKSGERLINLGDGSLGLLPEAWLKKFGPLAEMATINENGIRLNKVQALFFSASLEASDNLSENKKTNSLLKVLDDLRALKSSAVSKKFKGTLRSYQKRGLAWLRLLSQHKIGGVLADDMGLGKTIQVISLLCESKSLKERRPHLIVMPKSLIFNWQQELQKFAPHFTLLNYTGSNRHTQLASIGQHDLVLTTYQTLRSDIDKLKGLQFEYLILDEAHYIKNSQSQAYMACRLVTAERKLALTGTPVENSLSDLFSLLSVVSPGLISDDLSARWQKENDPDALNRLSRALAPFILRRSKEDVLKDLPEKTEQVLYCELSTSEKKKYDSLKSFYWGKLSGKIAEKDFSRSKIEVLEALLRLRQASCHQGLLDSSLRDKSSSKFDLLLSQIESATQEGHKVLIFSQFTTLLKLLMPHLKEKNISFEYLDGQTQNRAAAVSNFQNNPNIKIFLLSLKAGGVGLNLTAADYVFILDPWWNPAAESQAIDRTHRIGQTKKVFSYKIIAKDTVEEKILELQKRKKALAQAIMTSNKSLLKNLKMDDLRELFI